MINHKQPQFLYSSELSDLVGLTFPSLTWATGGLGIYALALLLALTGHEVHMQILLGQVEPGTVPAAVHLAASQSCVSLLSVG